jgi:hypothetical protein
MPFLLTSIKCATREFEPLIGREPGYHRPLGLSAEWRSSYYAAFSFNLLKCFELPPRKGDASTKTLRFREMVLGFRLIKTFSPGKASAATGRA